MPIFTPHQVRAETVADWLGGKPGDGTARTPPVFRLFNMPAFQQRATLARHIADGVDGEHEVREPSPARPPNSMRNKGLRQLPRFTR
jgi:hypothetical protein